VLDTESRRKGGGYWLPPVWYILFNELMEQDTRKELLILFFSFNGCSYAVTEDDYSPLETF
jgi:hypothetical protein